VSQILGVQVFSVYRELFEDYLGTLRRIAHAGYEAVELLSHNFAAGVRFSDLYPAKELKARLREWNLAPVSSHEIMTQGKDVLHDYDWDAIMRYSVELECPRVVIPWQWFLEREDTLRTAEKLDALGKRMRSHGLELYYHHHAHEFIPVGDTTAFELLLDNIDPAHLKVQLETAFVQLVGLDPAAFAERLGGRCDMVHQTDLGGTAGFRAEAFFDELLELRRSGKDIMDAYMGMFRSSIRSTDLGAGDFDFERFYERMGRIGGLKYVIVENETDGEGKVESIERDCRFMRHHINRIAEERNV